MPIFKRVKIYATVETEPLLLSDDQVQGALADLRDKLQHLDLEVLMVDTSEPPATPHEEPSSGDPWSIRGNPVD